MSDLFGPAGQALLASARLDLVYRPRIDSLLRLIDALDFEIDLFGSWSPAGCAGHPGYRAIQQIPGVGPVLAAVFVAEIGDISRFARPEQLCCWAGLTPRHHESDTTVHRGRITKQGSELVRWAAVEAVPAHPHRGRGLAATGSDHHRRGRNIGVVAAARRLLTLVFYGLRDGEIRALRRRRAA